MEATLGQYAGYVALVISIGTMVVGIINHKKIRSTCCGREASMSLDISATTPNHTPTVLVAATTPSEPLTVSGIPPPQTHSG